MTVDTPMSADEATVRTLLAVAGIPASEEEILTFAEDYPKLRGMVELLHAVPEARYEAPGLLFDPTPTFAEWG
ncbi:MAG TPA: hypothetical protein VGI44_11260 [Acidimicrobiales bacterium]|jgi:hypothetical protein